MGTPRGMETSLVPDAGYTLRLIDVGPLQKRLSPLVRLRTAFALPRSILACRHLIREFKPG